MSGVGIIPSTSSALTHRRLSSFSSSSSSRRRRYGLLILIILIATLVWLLELTSLLPHLFSFEHGWKCPQQEENVVPMQLNGGELADSMSHTVTRTSAASSAYIRGLQKQLDEANARIQNMSQISQDILHANERANKEKAVREEAEEMIKKLKDMNDRCSNEKEELARQLHDAKHLFSQRSELSVPILPSVSFSLSNFPLLPPPSSEFTSGLLLASRSNAAALRPREAFSSMVCSGYAESVNGKDPISTTTCLLSNVLLRDGAIYIFEDDERPLGYWTGGIGRIDQLPKRFLLHRTARPDGDDDFVNIQSATEEMWKELRRAVNGKEEADGKTTLNHPTYFPNHLIVLMSIFFPEVRE